MIARIVEYIVWALFAVVKFAVTPSAMIATDHHFYEALLVTGAGATLGLIAFYYSGPRIFDLINRLFRSKGRKKKVFTRKNRRIISFKKMYGLSGLALAAVLLSVPLTGILAGKYFKNSSYALPVLLISFWVWSLILTYVSWSIKYR